METAFGLLLWLILTLSVGSVIFFYYFEKMENTDDEI